jgi:hypothetical protein
MPSPCATPVFSDRYLRPVFLERGLLCAPLVFLERGLFCAPLASKTLSTRHGRSLRVMIGPHFEVENMTLANIIEAIVVLAVIVVAIRFFVKRAQSCVLFGSFHSPSDAL